MKQMREVIEILQCVSDFFEISELDFSEYGEGDFRDLIEDYIENEFEWSDEAVELSLLVLLGKSEQ